MSRGAAETATAKTPTKTYWGLPAFWARPYAGNAETVGFRGGLNAKLVNGLLPSGQEGGERPCTKMPEMHL